MDELKRQVSDSTEKVERAIEALSNAQQEISDPILQEALESLTEVQQELLDLETSIHKLCLDQPKPDQASDQTIQKLANEMLKESVCISNLSETTPLAPRVANIASSPYFHENSLFPSMIVREINTNPFHETPIVRTRGHTFDGVDNVLVGLNGLIGGAPATTLPPSVSVPASATEGYLDISENDYRGALTPREEASLLLDGFVYIREADESLVRIFQPDPSPPVESDLAYTPPTIDWANQVLTQVYEDSCPCGCGSAYGNCMSPQVVEPPQPCDCSLCRFVGTAQ